MVTPLDDSPLGNRTDYVADYDAGLLFGVARAKNRASLGVTGELPFRGEDLWNAYELSWLGPTGLPVVRVGTLIFDAGSPNIIESKSLKLYLNSLNNHRFTTEAHMIDTVEADLTKVSGAPVRMRLDSSAAPVANAETSSPGWCIDDPSTPISEYELNPQLLKGAAGGEAASATLYSDLLRSCCPVTGQPDWGRVLVRYQGPWIDHRALLRYIVSFRNHAEFHEHCVERMFVDILNYCEPTQLTVYARYTRRGGLDINPFRSNFEPPPPNLRHERQ